MIYILKQLGARLPIVTECGQPFTNAAHQTTYAYVPIWSTGKTNLWVNDAIITKKKIIFATSFSPLAYGPNGTRNPISVFQRAYIYFMQNLEAHDLVSIANYIQFVSQNVSVFLSLISFLYRIISVSFDSNLKSMLCCNCVTLIQDWFSEKWHQRDKSQ